MSEVVVDASQGSAEEQAATEPLTTEIVVQLPPTRRRRRAPLIVAVLLAVGLVAALAAGGWLWWQLNAANERIEKQQDQIKEQGDLIDQKEVFGAAMIRLHDSASTLAGLPFTSMVPWDDYDALAARGWAHRWHLRALEFDAGDVSRTADELDALQVSAQTEAASNGTGSAWETTIDQLGQGYVSTVLEDADAFCEEEVLACVSMDEPYTVHVDAASSAEPHMTDWLRTGVAYHEFAHVLQATNPQLTEPTLTVFGGDVERMADCYSLTVLPGWSLNHRVDISRYRYWEVEVGYGYTCNEPERQAIRDWVAQLTVVARPISQ